MNKYIVLCKLKHEKNSDNGNVDIHCQTINAHTFAEAEMKVKTDWAKAQIEAEIIQITIYS